MPLKIDALGSDVMECPGECAGALGVWDKMWLTITQDGMQKLGGRGEEPR